MIEEAFYREMKERMNKTQEVLRRDFNSIRTGRATPAILDRINVECYGEEMPLRQLVNVSVPDARMLVVSPYDRRIINNVEKAILKSDLGINPVVDGNVIRLFIPPLTEERRKELVKVIKKKAEESKVAIRNIRRDANEELKMMEKEKRVSEDDLRRAQDEIQKITDKFIKGIDALVAAKEKEIMEI